MQGLAIEELIEELILTDASDSESKWESEQLQRFFLYLLREVPIILIKENEPLSNLPDWEKSDLYKDKEKLLKILASIELNKQLKSRYVSAYLASLGHTLGTKNEILAYQWASANAYIILQLVNKHEPNIKKLCQRFRLAHQMDSDFSWVWEKLPELDKGLEFIVLELKKLEVEYKQSEVKQSEVEKSKDQPKAKKSSVESSVRIAEIRRPYETKHKIDRPRSITPDGTQGSVSDTDSSASELKMIIQDAFTQDQPVRISYYRDEDNIHLDEIVFQEFETIKGVSYLEQRDDHQHEKFVDPNYESEPEMENSANMQHAAIEQQIAHIQRNSFEFPTNPKILTNSQIQIVFKALWGSINQQNTYTKHKRNKLYVELLNRQIIDTCLLMSLLTASPAEIWLDFKGLHKNEKITFDAKRNAQLFWYPALDITQFHIQIKDAILADVQKNKHMRFALPLPNIANNILSDIHLLDGKLPDTMTIKARVSELRRELELPVLSLGRIQSALHAFIRRFTDDHYLADLICSVSPHHSPGLFYCSINLSQIENTYGNAVRQLSEKADNFNTDYLTPNFKPERCGSQITPTDKLVIDFFDQMRLLLLSKSEHIEQFNCYAIWMWHIFMILTSCRPVSHMPGMLNQIDLRAKLIWLSDKEGRITGSSGRFIPLCKFLELALNDYLAYLHDYLHSYGATDDKANLVLSKILSSEMPLLNIYIDGDLHPLTPKLVSDYVQNIFPFPLNWPRHFGRYYLYEKQLDVTLIDAIFGHEAPAHEALHPYSAVSMHDIKSAAIFYDQMAADLHLKQVKVHVPR
jgi:hypothetical protein